VSCHSLLGCRVSLDSGTSVGHTQVYAGRPVRRLVSFFDGVRDLIEENDRRMMLEVDLLQGEGDGADQVVHTIEYVYAYSILLTLLTLLFR
jgi:hypothetical protein